jgi:hypothetical protein
MKHSVRDEGVAGSNPATPTIISDVPVGLGRRTSIFCISNAAERCAQVCGPGSLNSCHCGRRSKSLSGSPNRARSIRNPEKPVPLVPPVIAPVCSASEWVCIWLRLCQS